MLKTLARQRDKAEVLRRLHELRPDSVPRWGRMSSHQMVCHVCDCLRMGLGRKVVEITGGLLQRTAVKWIALYSPLRWPEGLATSPETDQHRGGTPPLEFAADRAQLETLMELFTVPTALLNRQRHPVFGPMSDSDWLRWGYLHTDHHLRQFGV